MLETPQLSRILVQDKTSNYFSCKPLSNKSLELSQFNFLIKGKMYL